MKGNLTLVGFDHNFSYLLEAGCCCEIEVGHLPVERWSSCSIGGSVIDDELLLEGNLLTSVQLDVVGILRLIDHDLLSCVVLASVGRLVVVLGVIVTDALSIIDLATVAVHHKLDAFLGVAIPHRCGSWAIACIGILVVLLETVALDVDGSSFDDGLSIVVSNNPGIASLDGEALHAGRVAGLDDPLLVSRHEAIVRLVHDLEAVPLVGHGVFPRIGFFGIHLAVS